jgi:hypothetical protein
MAQSESFNFIGSPIEFNRVQFGGREYGAAADKLERRGRSHCTSLHCNPDRSALRSSVH